MMYFINPANQIRSESATGQGPVAICCEYGNKHSDSIKGEKFID